MNTKIDNVLAICTSKLPRTEYHFVNNSFYNGDSVYIEKFTKDKLNYYSQRAYVYNKAKKEKLLFPITRFELKLQNRFFLKNEFDTNSIINALDRYCVMYFANEIEKERKICEYNKYKIVTTREIDRLGFRSYRLYPNPAVIKEFMRQIKSVYVGFYWDIVIPLASPNYKNHFFKKN